MEKTGLFIVLVFMVGGYVFAKESDSLACCPPSHYLLRSDHCFDAENNKTIPMRLSCIESLKYTDFTVDAAAGVIQLLPEEGDTSTYTFSYDVACYGNMTKDTNLSIVKSVALLCITEEEKERVIEDSTLGYCMIASVLFLAWTAIIYTVFKELRDLFGKSVINFCTSLAIGLGILSIMKTMAYSNMATCAVRGFLGYFFLLVAFFWTSSISIQVLKDTRRPLVVVDYGWHEFKWYVIYSWGLPTILTTIMAIVNYHPGDHQKPGIGLNHCWFFTKAQQWYYMYSVMTILLVINIGIFIYVATMVWRHSFRSTQLQALKFKLSMTMRLIVLMGLPWIFEMISSVADGGELIWAIVDVFNSLQGILIFLVLVVFRKRVIKVLHKRGYLDCCSGLVEKWLAVGDDAEENVVQHTDVPLSDDHHRNGIARCRYTHKLYT